jgi:hypothetical protein
MMTQRKQKGKDELLKYLKKNPDATFRDLVKAGFGPVLRNHYHRRVNDARIEAGIQPREGGRRLPPSQWKERKAKLLEYLRENPEASSLDLYKKGLGSPLWRLYKGKINEAKNEAGVPVRKKARLSSSEWEERKTRLLEYLKKNPGAEFKDLVEAGFRSTLKKLYQGRINEARIEAGLPVRKRGE